MNNLRLILLTGVASMLTLVNVFAADFGKPVTWDRHSLLIDGRRVCPVMGEVHYSRIPANEWRREVSKMREGGVTVLATYVFWNHIEEQEGVFDWNGQRDLRQFLEVCRQEGMPVVLRIGPFCHGEVRNGGIPDWMFQKGCRLRSQDKIFLQYVERLYRQIFTQVQGLQWKDGGPIIAAQFDNEYRGSGDYLMALKKIALQIGYDLPFYTRTGWPELSKPVPFGEMLPLYGDYADGFWDKDIKEGVGNYYKAFNFKAFRSSTAIGTDLLGKQEEKVNKDDNDYPYFTCELGGGMVTAYHRRPFVYPEDAYSMALVKLGSGSNLLGYYMYHGGTNPEGKLHRLNEVQTSPGTANNDLPIVTYDFQAPLGEFGQTYPQYYMLRPLHLFLQDYGELLAPMEASFPANQDLKKGEDSALRWAVRTAHSSEAGNAASAENAAFIFVNNYERFYQLSVKKNVVLEAAGVKLPKLTIPSGCMAIFPVNVDGIRYATAQLVAKRNGKIYLMQVKGIPTTIALQNGKILKNLKPKGTARPVFQNIYLLSQEEAEHFGLPIVPSEKNNPVPFVKIKEAGLLRKIVKGRAKVAEAPTEDDWEQAAVYKIDLSHAEHSSLLGRGEGSPLLNINYRGDCARLYADGKLIADNFYYGRPFFYGLWRLPEGTKELELRILPLQPDAPIYLPREADKTAGEQVKSIVIRHLSNSVAQESVSLAGKWQFAQGDTPAYNDYVTLPGSMLTNGKGNPVSTKTQWTGSLYDSSFYFNPYMEKYRHEGAMKFPFFLTPEKHYVGNAWYQRLVDVPKEWKNQRVMLFLERPHIETTVFVNGQQVGSRMSLSTPHSYDVTDYLHFGKKNEISIRVYNGIENVCVGQDSHSVTDQTQGNWNGIVGRIELTTMPQPSIKVVPDVARKQVTIFVDGEPHQIALGDSIRFWSEFDPYLYTRNIQHHGRELTVTFGVRDISIRGRQLYLNGNPLFLRGTVENCCFPLTGYPPTDEAEWLRIFRKCKEYGLNHVRFHSYCPPEAAFAAADKVGIYLQPEGPSWPNHGVRLRRGQKIDDYLLEESKRIIDTYGHHPSFVMMTAGNEPAGDWVSYCNDWVKEMKQYDPTKIYAGASVGGGWAWDGGSEFHVKGGARGLDDWNRRAPSSDDDYYQGILYPRNYKDTIPNNTPIITHEKGQWCAFPDFKETAQYTGAYKAHNFEIFRDLLRDNGMESMAGKFLMASGRLQTLCYKYEIERNLRTKDYAGFQLLGLNDYSGQGTALVGVLNVFWREKGYCTSNDWRQFCSPLVALAHFPKFVFTNSDTLRVPVEAYHAQLSAIRNLSATYIITDEASQIVSSGRLYSGSLPVGKNHSLGTVVYALNEFKNPQKLTLTVQLSDSVRNHWDFWVYPADASKTGFTAEGKFAEYTELTDEALAILQAGGTVLLTAAGKVTLGSDVKQNYLPVFWNTSWFKMRPPHVTGAYINKQHPLFKHGFPTDDWSNLNWWELLNKAQVMNLMELPRDYQSPIQPIDTWHVSRKLGMLIEARVAGGRLLMTTMDITNNLAQRPVARQMRKAILSYMQSADFLPSLRLDAETIRHFYTKQAPAVNMFTNDSPDELKPKIK